MTLTRAELEEAVARILAAKEPPAEPSEQQNRKGTATAFLPTGTWQNPPADRRRWNANLVNLRPWDIKFAECRRHPGKWSMLCMTNRPEGVTYRIRTGVYGGTKTGEWEATQRSIGNGYGVVYVRFLKP